MAIPGPARSFNQRILDLDFSVPTPGNPTLTLQKNGSGEGEGEQILAKDIQVSDAYEIFGCARCDKGATLKFYWGFSHSNAVPPMVYGNGAAIQYDIFESATVPASYTEGAGVKIGPLRVGGQHLKVTATNTATDATTNFRIFLIKRS